MESWQTSYISSNLVDLIKHTECSTKLLLQLQQMDLLSTSETEEIESYEDETAKAARLYNLLFSRKSAYSRLFNSLQEFNQFKAVSILEDGIENALSSLKIRLTDDTVSLKELLGHFEFEKFILFMKFKNKNKQKFFQEAMECLSNEAPLNLFKDTLPRLTSEYVPRQIFQRRILNQEVLNFPPPEMFTTNITCTNTDRLTTVLHYALEQRKIFNLEEEFFTSIDMENTPERVICICDAPGTGKSMLLSSLAMKSKVMFSNRITAFFSVHQLLQHKVLFGNADDNFYRDVSQLLGDTELAREILFRVFQKRHISINLFLDGSDKLQGKDLEDIQTLVKNLQTKFPKSKVFITNRAHRKLWFDQKIQQACYGIVPLTAEEQCSLLQKVWQTKLYDSEEPNIINQQSSIDCLVHNFARECLAEFNKRLQLDDTINPVLGVPAQCKIFAELYSGEYRRKQTYNFGKTDFEIMPIAELYDKIIDLKFNYSRSHQHRQQKKARMTGNKTTYFHTLIAINQLFPSLVEFYYQQNIADFELMETDDWNLGLLQQSPGKNAVWKELTFIHKTFAEYFAAAFFADFLFDIFCTEKKLHYATKILQCLTEKVLSTSKTMSDRKKYPYSFQMEGYIYPFHIFQESMIPYFLDNHIKKYPFVNLSPEVVQMILKTECQFRVSEILQACVHDNLQNMLNLFQNVLRTSANINQLQFLSPLQEKTNLEKEDKCLEPWYIILRLAADNVNINLMKNCVDVLKVCFLIDVKTKCQNLSLKQYTPLHSAVAAADYELVEYLLGIIHPIGQRKLLYVCVENTVQDSLATLKDREDICNLLLSYDRELLNEITENHNGQKLDSPAFACDVHPYLIAQLIQLGARQTFGNQMEQTLHLVLEEGLKIKNETLKELFQTSALLAKHVNEKGNNLLMSAIMGKQDVSILETLFECGVDHRYKNVHGRSILHLAAEFGEEKTVIFCLENNLDINDLDNFSQTPIHLSSRRLHMILFLIRRKADVTKADATGSTVAHHAAENLSEKEFDDFVDIFLGSYQKCSSIFGNKNIKWRTPLHERLHCEKGISVSTVSKLLKLNKLDIDSIDVDGFNLFLSAIHGRKHVDVLNILLKYGVKANIKTKNGRTPVLLAVEKKHAKALRLLKVRGSVFFHESFVKHASSTDEKTTNQLAKSIGKMRNDAADANKAVKQIEFLLNKTNLHTDKPLASFLGDEV